MNTKLIELNNIVPGVVTNIKKEIKPFMLTDGFKKEVVYLPKIAIKNIIASIDIHYSDLYNLSDEIRTTLTAHLDDFLSRIVPYKIWELQNWFNKICYLRSRLKETRAYLHEVLCRREGKPYIESFDISSIGNDLVLNQIETFCKRMDNIISERKEGFKFYDIAYYDNKELSELCYSLETEVHSINILMCEIKDFAIGALPTLMELRYTDTMKKFRALYSEFKKAQRSKKFILTHIAEVIEKRNEIEELYYNGVSLCEIKERGLL